MERLWSPWRSQYIYHYESLSVQQRTFIDCPEHAYKHARGSHASGILRNDGCRARLASCVER